MKKLTKWSLSIFDFIKIKKKKKLRKVSGLLTGKHLYSDIIEIRD